MKLTPLDIRHKEFKRGMRGYVDGEVDEFLDEVADEFERLFKENIELSERGESLQEKLDQYRNLEETLQNTLVAAQRSAEELRANAQKEAQLIMSEAELKAREMVNQSYADKQTGREADRRAAQAAEEDFRFKFRSLLEGYAKQLAEADAEATKKAEPLRRAHGEQIRDAMARDAAARPVPGAGAPSPDRGAPVPLARAARPAPASRRSGRPCRRPASHGARGGRDRAARRRARRRRPVRAAASRAPRPAWRRATCRSASPTPAPGPRRPTESAVPQPSSAEADRHRARTSSASPTSASECGRRRAASGRRATRCALAAWGRSGRATPAWPALGPRRRRRACRQRSPAAVDGRANRELCVSWPTSSSAQRRRRRLAEWWPRDAPRDAGRSAESPASHLDDS